MFPFSFATLALLFFIGRHADAVKCSAEEKLTLEYMNKTTQAGDPSTCADGTAPSIYYDLPNLATHPLPVDWIIYLGDGETCDEEECNELCDLDVDKEGGVCFGINDDFSGLTDSDIQNLDQDVLECYFARVQC